MLLHLKRTGLFTGRMVRSLGSKTLVSALIEPETADCQRTILANIVEMGRCLVETACRFSGPRYSSDVHSEQDKEGRCKRFKTRVADLKEPKQ